MHHCFRDMLLLLIVLKYSSCMSIPYSEYGTVKEIVQWDYYLSIYGYNTYLNSASCLIATVWFLHHIYCWISLSLPLPSPTSFVTEIDSSSSSKPSNKSAGSDSRCSGPHPVTHFISEGREEHKPTIELSFFAAFLHYLFSELLY